MSFFDEIDKEIAGTAVEVTTGAGSDVVHMVEPHPGGEVSSGSANDKANPWKVDHLSYSQLSSFLWCQRKYYYSRLRMIREPKSEALLYGSSLHKGIEFINRWIINNRPKGLPGNLNTDEIFSKSSVLVHEAEENKEEEARKILLDEGRKNIFMSNGKNHLIDYTRWVSGVGYDPRSLEEKWNLIEQDMGIRFTLIIDMVATNKGKPLIVDFKTSSKNYPESKGVKNSIQLALYGIAADINEVETVVFVKTKVPKIQTSTDADFLKHKFTKDELDFYRGFIKIVSQKIIHLIRMGDEKGIGAQFIPIDPTEWKCSDCFYSTLCRNELKNLKLNIKKEE